MPETSKALPDRSACAGCPGDERCLTEPCPFVRWRCASGHELLSREWMGDDCPHRDREDGSWCGSPMNRVPVEAPDAH